MNIFQKIDELNLPKGHYVVVGGGVLAALSLLEWNDDIDMCVTPEIFAELCARGWRQEDGSGKPLVRHDIYDIGVGFGDWSLDDLLADAVWINDIPFMNPEKLLEWKRQAARSKDMPHIKLIEKYLSQPPSS
jgi:hypothetical protein